MPTSISGTAGVTYPAGGLANTAGAGVGTTDSQTLTNKTLTSPTLTTPNIDSAQIPTVSGTAPLYMCRAWVNFNGTSTVAIRASGNVTSITDNGTGDYTVNFTTALVDANYSVVGVVSNTDAGTGLILTINSNGVGPTYTTAPTTTATRMLSFARATGSNTDAPYVCVSIFR